MSYFQQIFKLRRNQLRKVRERQFRRAYHHFADELKREQKQHHDEIADLKRIHERELQREQKRVQAKLRELDELHTDLNRREEELKERIQHANEHLTRIDEIKGRMDGAIEGLARVVQMAGGAYDDAESLKRRITSLN